MASGRKWPQPYMTCVYGVSLPPALGDPVDPVTTDKVYIGFPRAPNYDTSTVLKLLAAHYRRQAEQVKGKKAKRAYLDAADTAELWLDGLGTAWRETTGA